MKEEQRQYLQFRQDFLEEQLLYHRDDQVREASLHPRRSPVGDDDEDERAFFVTQNQQVRYLFCNNTFCANLDLVDLEIICRG